MQLLQRTSYPCPVVNPLIIFCGFCVFVQLIHFVYIPSCVDYANVATFWITTWSIAGGAGSYSLLLTFLCIKFPGTNSMSVPRGNFKKLYSLFKKVPPTKASISSKKKSKQGKKTDSRKGKRPKSHGSPALEKDGNNKLSKSKHNFLPDISTTGAYSSISATTDHDGVTSHANPTIFTKHSNLLSHQLKERKDKRKSERQGKNANEFLTSNPSLSSSLRQLVLMNQNEGEALRREILAKVEELDPLMCLPKVLCGYSSRRRHNKYSRLKTTTATTTTSTTRRPIIATGIIDEYLHLLGIIPPITENGEKDVKETETTYLKSKKKSPKDTVKLRKSKKQKKTKKKKSDEIEKEGDHAQQSESGSSSVESDESAGYERYPIGRPQREKFLFNRNRNKDNEGNDIDENDDDDESTEEDDDEDDLLDDEDVKYIVEKAKMEKLMGTSGSHSEENWWDPFDEQKIYQKTMSYYLPPPDPSYDPLASDDILSLGSTNDGEGITGWFSNMFSNFMPRISWGGVAKKDDDDFKSDPFFTSFDGRSMKNGESPSFSRSNNFNGDLTLPSLSSPHYYQDGERSGKQLELEKYFGLRVNSRQLDYTSGNDQENPVAKYHIAVEIGSRATDPNQCDFVYNGCPLAYEEILAIINEPVRYKPSSTRSPHKPYTKTATTTTGNTSFNHKFIPPLPPPPLPQRQNVVPLHQQQQQQFSFQQPPSPPQTIFLHPQSPHQYTLPHQHSSQMQLYNQQFIQHQQLPQQHQPISENDLQFHQHNPALFSTAPDGIMAQASNTHKTKIHQALPSGEVEINLSFSSERKKPKLPPGAGVVSNNLYMTPGMNTGGETLLRYPHFAPVGSYSTSFENSHLTDPFNHKVLNYEFFPSNGYKIRRRNEQMEKSVPNKDVKVVSNTMKEGGSSAASSSFMNESHENSDIIEMSPSVPGKSSKKRKQEIPSSSSSVTFNNKGKHKRKQMSKGTFPPSSSAPPLRQSSHRQSILPQQQASQEKKKKKMNENNKRKSIIREKYVKEKQNKNKKKKIHKDDNSSSSSGNSSDDGISSSSSNEHLEQYGKGQVVRKKYLDDMKTQRKRMKRRRKPHLHKQSSESIEAKKRLKIAAPNAIYPVYGHPFPPPYAGHYHTLHPSTPTSPSFFSYFFGR